MFFDEIMTQDTLSTQTELKGHLVNIMATMFRRLTSFAPIWRVPFLRTKKDDDFDKVLQIQGIGRGTCVEDVSRPQETRCFDADKAEEL